MVSLRSRAVAAGIAAGLFMLGFVCGRVSSFGPRDLLENGGVSGEFQATSGKGANQRRDNSFLFESLPRLPFTPHRPSSKIAAKPDEPEPSTVVIRFDRICFFDTGTINGGGTGMWMTVYRDGRLVARPKRDWLATMSSGTSRETDQTRQLTAAELALLARRIQAVDWKSLEQGYRTGCADMLTDQFEIDLDGKTFTTSIDDGCSSAPKALYDLRGCLNVIYEKYINTTSSEPISVEPAD
jgi:hypothetical protein